MLLTRPGNVNGKQGGDPKKGARAMWDLAKMDNPPLRMVIGSDAYEKINEKIEQYGKLYGDKEYAKLASKSFPSGESGWATTADVTMQRAAMSTSRGWVGGRLVRCTAGFSSESSSLDIRLETIKLALARSLSFPVHHFPSSPSTRTASR